MNTLMTCPLCHGEGCLEEVVSGGYFDMQAECWYPLERFTECPECFGCGTVELEDSHERLDREQAA